jgi:putative transposase
LYNAFLEQRRLAWRLQGISLGESEQSADLTRLRQEDNEIGALSAQSCQVTLNRVGLAFQAFFRRVKAGEEPGYPRFKTFNRFSGWGYKTHGDGWALMPGEKGQHGKLRLSGVAISGCAAACETKAHPRRVRLCIGTVSGTYRSR